ncbi:MAG: FAD-binding and (Fe-S)-binding domain-containing protein [SAR324 cluster bacterium]|nr:FAD-binding and (Fe-S)-binding domain-containing protein [SAR324 cluster bacterium]
MIPRLQTQNSPDFLTQKFLISLKAKAFEGEIESSFAERLALATDNSVYQVVPSAVLYPKNKADIAKVLTLLGTEEFKAIKVTPRGGGTGTNGQSLSHSIMMDLSRHLTKVKEINVNEGWVSIEAGVVLDQLNRELKPHGYFFAPTLSTSSRATLGGMINTDACGKGSRVYGKTSQHIVELTTLALGGGELVTTEITTEELETIKSEAGFLGEVYNKVDEIIQSNQNYLTQLPQLTRFLTGYNLSKVKDEKSQFFNLNYLLSGSEGTLAVIAEAKLKLTPIVKHKKLFLLKYDDFLEALADASVLVDSDPIAIETIDERILTLAQDDEIFESVGPLLGEDAKQVKAVNLVEFSDDTEELLNKKVQPLIDSLEAKKSKARGYYIAQNEGEIAALWELRKKGVGLLGALKGKRKPIAFVEDTVVPPENLKDYITEFRALLESYGLVYGMFGHVDVGCLHVRPALDMLDLEDEKLLVKLTSEVAVLVKKFGGVIWGEHGKGYRSQYSETYFGPELYQEMRKVKGLFDPHNQLNPGKIATPIGALEPLVEVDGPFRGLQDRQIHPDLLKAFETSVNCNGNGACFTVDTASLICPSYRTTKDRLHSPKGRAVLIREWLRRMSLETSHLQIEPGIYAKYNLLNWARRAKNSFAKYFGAEDFSHDVLQALDGCLACKACQGQCPIKVDIPELKSKFLSLYYQRYLRPISDYLAIAIEKVAQDQSSWAEFFNGLLGLNFVRSLVKTVAGIVDTPHYSTVPLQAELTARGALIDWGTALFHYDSQKTVILVQDAFTSFYEAHILLRLHDFLEKQGIKLLVLPFAENGKALHVKGFLSDFRDVARSQAKRLEKVAKYGIPLVGIDPAVALTYRDEYPEILGQELNFKVLLLQEYLLAFLSEPQKLTSAKAIKLFAHCTEKTANPKSEAQWKEVFGSLGLNLETESVGCCGMCGIFGHEARHSQASKDVYEMHWEEKLKKAAEAGAIVLATGYSCRSQVKRFEGFVPLHPVELLFDLSE